MRKLSHITFAFLFSVGAFTSCGLFFSDDPTYTLITTASPEEGGTIMPSKGEFEQGEQIILRAQANDGWQFVRWEGDLNTSSPVVNLTMNQNYSVIGIFEIRSYPLNLVIEGEGTVREEVIQQKVADYKHGTIVELSAEPAPDWRFVEWSGDVEDDKNRIEILIDRELNITAHFRYRKTIVAEVTNPSTGHTWMDRNLGASHAATSSTDANAYGDLYQWGRPSDGHQWRDSPTISTLSSSDQPGHGRFILAPNSPWDWRSPQNDNLWQGVEGINNPCPAGFRLPTEAEWGTEINSWSSFDAAGAFSSPLKLPMAGQRFHSDGVIFLVGSEGSYWSSSVSGRGLVFYTDGAGVGIGFRASGQSVRCIKD